MKISELRLLANQDRVLVCVDDDLDRSLEPGEAETALIIPEAHRRFSRTGTVLAAGLGRETRKGKFVRTTVVPGDRVLLPLTGDDTHSYDIGGREHRIIHEAEILGVVE